MSRVGWCAVAALMLLEACLPTTDTVRTHDTIVRTTEITDGTEAPAYQLRIVPSPEALTVTAEQTVACTREKRHTVHRIRAHEIETNHALHAMTYVLGLAGMAIGGVVLAENVNAAIDTTSISGGESSTENKFEGIAIGGGIAAIGTALFLVAIGSSFNAIDQETDVGITTVPVEGSRHVAECDRGPAKALQIGLVVAAQGAVARYVALGETDAQGVLVVAWPAMQGKLPSGAPDTAGVVAGPAAEVATQVASGLTPKIAGVVVLPAHDDPQREWLAAVGADTAASYREYVRKYPDSPHAAEAVRHARDATTHAAMIAFDSALSVGAMDAAAKALDTLRSDGDPVVAQAAGARYDAANRTARIARARGVLPVAIAAIETSEDPAAEVARARGAVTDLRSLATDDATAADAVTAEAQIDVAVRRLSGRLVKAGEAAYARRDFDAGAASFAAAAAVAVDAAAVARAHDAAILGALKKGHAEARRLAAAGNYDDALDLLDVLMAAAGPAGDEAMAAEHVKWEAAGKAQLDAERKKIQAAGGT